MKGPGTSSSKLNKKKSKQGGKSGKGGNGFLCIKKTRLNRRGKGETLKRGLESVS